MAAALLAAGGVLTWHEAEPGAELSTVLELVHVTDGGHDGRSGDRADSLALYGDLCGPVFASVRFDRVLVLPDSPCTEKLFFAKSIPMVVTLFMTSPFRVG